MRALALAMSGLLAGIAIAQSPLSVAPTGGGFYTWNPTPASQQMFFDLTVNTSVTVRSLRFPVSMATLTGTVSIWLTNPGITTWVGSETTPTNWYQASSGTLNTITATYPSFFCESCQETSTTSLVLQPGTYGCAVRFANVPAVFYALPTVPDTFANAELSVTTGAIQYTSFVSAVAAPVGPYAGWSWFGDISYTNGAWGTNCASAAPYGAGCYGSTPLQLSASAPPQRGATINLVTSNPPNTGLGISFIGQTGMIAGLDLAVVGAPGCFAYADPNTSVVSAISNLGIPGVGMSTPLAIPNWPWLLGAQLFAQSAWLDPAANPFGVVTSNGLVLVID